MSIGVFIQDEELVISKEDKWTFSHAFPKLSKFFNVKTSFQLIIGPGKRFSFGPPTTPAILSEM